MPAKTLQEQILEARLRERVRDANLRRALQRSECIEGHRVDALCPHFAQHEDGRSCAYAECPQKKRLRM